MPVQIDLRVEDDHWTDLADLSGLCERAITAAALRTMPDKSATIDVLLADNRALAALNKQWRDKDGPTDRSCPQGCPRKRGVNGGPFITSADSRLFALAWP